MLATRWQPFAELNRLSREMDRMISAGTRHSFSGTHPAAFPALNVWEDEQNVFVETEIPGFTLDQIEVLMDGNSLTIKGEAKPCEPEGGRWLRRERSHASFSRTIELPCALSDEAIEAKLENGVLFVTLPKAEAARPRRIEVKHG